MPKYKYVALDKSRKKQKGIIDAPSKRVAMIKLQENGIVSVISLTEIKQKRLRRVATKVSLKALTLATRQLATMLASGLQLVEALSVVTNQIQDKYLREVFDDITTLIKRGDNTFAQALAKYPHVFPPMYSSIIKAAQISGNLDEALNDLATMLEKNLELRKKIKSALTYPVVVLTISLAIFIGIVIFVIPKFENIFKEFGIKQMPALTSFMIGFGHFLINNWLYILLAIIGIYLANYFGIIQIRLSGGKFDTIKLKLPIIGPLIKASVLAQLASTLATMVRNGISPTEALDASKNVVVNAVYRKVLDDIVRDIKQGKSLSYAFGKHPSLFPDIFISMLKAGETAGALDSMLERIAAYYSSEVDSAIEGLTSAIEPLTVLLLAGLVGTAIVSIYLPIFSMISQMNL